MPGDRCRLLTPCIANAVSLSLLPCRDGRHACQFDRSRHARQVVFRLAPAMNFVAPRTILFPFLLLVLSPLILLLISFGTIGGNI